MSACAGTQLTLSFYSGDPWHWNLINNQEAIIQMWKLIHQISNKQTKQGACINDCLALYINFNSFCALRIKILFGKRNWAEYKYVLPYLCLLILGRFVQIHLRLAKPTAKFQQWFWSCRSQNLGVRIHKVKHTHCLKALSNHKTKWVVSRRCIYTHTDSNKPSQAHPIAVMLKHTRLLTHSLTQRAKRKEINKTPSICFWMHQLSQASFNLVI